MDIQSYLGLLVFIVACVATAMSGAIFRPDAWYRQLKKPSWQPPDWLFGPAWTVFYALIAVAGWMVWLKAGFAGAALPLTLYFLQLALNALWSAIFFGMRRIGLAAVETVFMWLVIVATIVTFYPIEPRAAWLMVPYLCWVSFAFVLNVTVWRLNAGPPEAKTDPVS